VDDPAWKKYTQEKAQATAAAAATKTQAAAAAKAAAETDAPASAAIPTGPVGPTASVGAKPTRNGSIKAKSTDMVIMEQLSMVNDRSIVLMQVSFVNR